jgi:hypothetical protein
MNFVQCAMKQVNGNQIEVAWLNADVVKEGTIVKLKHQEDCWWYITSRGDKVITQAQLEALQANARKGFASTEA